MQGEEDGRDVTAEIGRCLSFRGDPAAAGTDSPTTIPDLRNDIDHPLREQTAGDEEDEDFEFAFVLSGADHERGYMTADEIFLDGVVRPVYSVLSRPSAVGKPERSPLRRLLMEEKESEKPSRSSSVSSSASASSARDDLEGVPRDSYCAWTPGAASASASPCRKSISTGSSFRLRFRDLVVGRSHSDGNPKLLLLATPNPNPKPNPNPNPNAKRKGKERNGGGGVKELDIVAAHRLYYARKNSATAAAAKTRQWRSFLPYRPDLVGQFGSVNGFRWSQSPS